jgi:murein DD-endopeptidase MepM/ murein hydrolase activator NlpD
MRRIFFIVLIAVCGFIAYGVRSYIAADWRLAPEPAVAVALCRVSEPQTTAAERTLAPAEAEWRASLLNGFVHKALSLRDGAAEAALGPVGTAPVDISLTLPQGFAHRVRLSRDGVLIFDKRLAAWDALTLEAGAYALEIDSSLSEAARTAAGYGVFRYRCGFTVEPEPEPALLPGRSELAQGDVVALRLVHIPQGVFPRAETELGPAIFTPDGAGSWYAAVPVSNTQSPGRYAIRVQAGEADFDVEVVVRPFDFVKQNLVVDTGSSEISEASSYAAYREYREKIPPLFDTYDAERHWRGIFSVPAAGEISTEFGTIRYTNGDYTRHSVHNGMDIAAPEGTPVFAPNAGHAVMAERLLNTGNTVVIEHGGGLKSYYFHLSRIDVTPGDMVEKGELIGAVGSTGYSTGPHLHYEMRIGNRPINPAMLFDAGAGLYSVDTE